MSKFHLSHSFLATCLIVIGFTVYMFSFSNGLFWDDDDFILKNTYIQDWKYLPQIFSENVIAGSNLVSNYWRPVLLMVFSVEWHLWGAWAPGWHMVNTLFHVTNGVLLFWIMIALLRSVPIYRPLVQPINRHTTNTRWLAFFVALLFLIHPVQVEAVAYANSLGDSLSVFFMFLGVLCFQNTLSPSPLPTGEGRERVANSSYESDKTYKTYAWLLASLATYPLALMSKETAIIMPALLALCSVPIYRLHFLPINGHTTRSLLKIILETGKQLSRPLWLFIIIAITYLALRATSLNFKNSFNLYDESNIFTDSLWVRLLTFCKIIVEYIKLIFWPQNLHMDRSLEFATSLFDWQVLLGGLIIIALLILAWKSWQKNPLITFGILWFFIALAPTSNIVVPINGLLYEHWLYMPIVGIVLAVCSVPIYRLHLWPINRHTTTTVIIIVSIALAARTIVRIRDWRDPITFYKQTIQYAPNSYRINNNLAMSLANSGQFQEATEYYKKAIQLDNTNPVAFHNLGNIYEAAGNSQIAVTYYEKAIELDPKFLFSYPKLINNYYNIKNYNQAMSAIDQYMAQVGKQPELVKLRNQIEQEQLQLLLGNMNPQ